MAVAALLVAERRQSALGVWLSKPIASTAFLAAAVAAGALQSGYGTAILWGLALSWLGDVLLIARGKPRVFLCGVMSFLLGHVAYVTAFAGRGMTTAGLAPMAVAVVLAGAGAGIWLWPHVEHEMKIAVPAYIGVISAMVLAAIATHMIRPSPWILAGALGFYFSDLSVARDRFVAPGFVNKAWGLPLYYAAQVVLAWSIAMEH